MSLSLKIERPIMTQLTNQEIFDKALFGIRAQNYAPSGTSGSCQYRGQNGTKCAIGHCIDDKTAYKWDNSRGTSIGSVSYSDPVSFKKYFAESDLEFLGGLQVIHDTVTGKTGGHAFENDMYKFAKKHDLHYTTVEEQKKGETK